MLVNKSRILHNNVISFNQISKISIKKKDPIDRHLMRWNLHLLSWQPYWIQLLYLCDYINKLVICYWWMDGCFLWSYHGCYRDNKRGGFLSMLDSLRVFLISNFFFFLVRANICVFFSDKICVIPIWMSSSIYGVVIPFETFLVSISPSRASSS